MLEINLIVNDQEIELAEPVTIVSGSENVYLCKFAFTEEWTGFEKTAVFLSRTDAREVYMSNNQCTIPWEALEIDDIRRQELKIGVYGVKGDVRMPTVYTKPLSVHPGAETAEGGGTPTPTQWEQILELLSEGTVYIDPTLTTPGKGADAKVTGDNINALGEDLAEKLYKPELLTELAASMRRGGTLYNATTGEFVTEGLSTAYRCFTFDVTAGDFVRVRGIQPSASYALYSIFNANDELMLMSPADITGSGEKNQDISIPEGASYMHVNGSSAYPPTVLKIDVVENIAPWYQTLQTKLNKPYALDEQTPTATYQNSAYQPNNGIVVVNNYHLKKYTVSGGEEVHIEGVMPSASNVLYSFFDERDFCISYAPASLTKTGKVTADADVPVGAVYMYVLGYTSYPASMSVFEYIDDISDWRTQIEENTADIDALISGKLDKPYVDSTEATPTQTYTDKLYDATTNELIDTSTLSLLYHCNLYNVEAGERYHVIGIQAANLHYDLCTILDDNDNVLLRVSFYPDTGKKEAYITMPNDAAVMYVNGANVAEASAIERTAISDITVLIKTALSARRTNDGLVITDGDFIFNWRKIGANNLMNFYSATYKGTSLFATNTDWIGPYDFSAVNNADGDRLDPTKGVISSNTTGGNHNIYTDEPANGTPTARTIDWKVFADGTETENANIEGSCIEIRWVNRVQAGNTAKLEKDDSGYGTGRECLEEHGFARFMGNGLIEVGVDFTPLEDIQMHWYSGLQFAGSTFAPSLYIPEYNKQVMPTSEVRTHRNGAVVDYAVAKGSAACLEMYLDRDFGCGKNVVDYYYDGNGSKGYFILFSRGNTATEMHADEWYTWRGHYRFYPTV